MWQHGRRAAWLVIVSLAASTQVACAPARVASAPPQTAAAEPLIVDDVIGRTLQSEGLLGALARIDAELGPTLVSEKPRVSVTLETVSAKSPPTQSFDDEVIVTWGGGPSAATPSTDEGDDLADLPNVQR